MGIYMLQSLQNRDYVPAQTIILTFAAATVLINLIVDLLYGVLDPRIKYT